MNFITPPNRGAFRLIDELPALARRREPVVAAVWGFMLGGLGLGFYFRTWIDVFLPTMIWIIMGIVGIPTGEVLLALAPVFCATYGYHRAKSSNRKLGAQVEVVVPPIPTALLSPSLESRLRDLNDLYCKKLLTETEYEEKRQQILRSI